MELIERYWYLAAGILGGAAWLWLFFVWRRRPEESKGMVGFLLFGPFLPVFDAYLRKRGGLTRRELIGWGAVVLIAVVAIILTPSRGGS